MSNVNELNTDLDPDMYDHIDIEALKVLRESPIVDELLVHLKRMMQRDRTAWEKELTTGTAAHGSYSRGRWDASLSAYSAMETALNPEVLVWCESCENDEEKSVFAHLIVPNSREI